MPLLRHADLGGGDLTKAQKREAGQVVGAFQPGAAAPVKCPACGTANPASAGTCQACGRPLGAAPSAAPAPAAGLAPAAQRGPAVPWALVGGIAGLLCLAGLAFLIFQSFNTSAVTGTVQAVRWERSIGIEAQQPVQHSAWVDQVPEGARVGTCELRPRQFLDAPDPNRRSDKVCGTPYSVDQGDGTSKVVQDCQYQIYDDYCPYTVLEWQEVDRVRAAGADLQPYWPDLSLTDGQREGRHDEAYAVSFAADSQAYDYSVGDAGEFAQFAPGSRWILKINGLGGLNAVEPAQ
ncbi:MAG: hypothetical protein JNK29_14065 [Anaerolineales bacterium]|nr:hypothetical protein [Anaerolineales bacterium]